MNHVQSLLYSDVKINLTEVVTQNKDVINSKLKMEVNNLDLVANQLSDSLKRMGKTDTESIKKAFMEYYDKNKDQDTYVADSNGSAFFANGTNLQIEGRKYFRLAMKGNQNISERVVSRLTGEDIFAISVPLYYGSKIIGTVQRSYSPQQMYELCSISLFSSQGYMYIINSEGYIMVSSANSGYRNETENYFRLVYAQGNSKEADIIKKDIHNNKEGFIETVIDGKKVYSAYTPIEQIHDWYLISSVVTDAVSPNANTVIKMFYFILMVIVVIVGLSVFYFLSYKNQQQSHLEQIAFVDTITRGHTYNKFAIDLKEVLYENPHQKYYILAFDIDNFKYVNSFYGFDFGDKMLRRVHNDIRQRLLPGETVARISGDHFVMMLTDATEQRLDKLLDWKWSDDDFGVDISSGIYAISDPKENVGLMVDKASTASRSAKGLLKKKVVFYSEQFDQDIMHNEQLKRQIETALEKRDIIPFYQPKVDINTGTLLGSEALARWRKEDGRMVSPIEFIPLCEKTGQISDLDMSIFEQVLEFLQKNLAEGVACTPISVNFSRIHLLKKDFIHTIMGMLEQYNVPPHLIEIELTESIFFDNYEVILNFANHLHEHGLLICMDDFGSGYSSLNMLMEIPIDVLKIDKGFLDETKSTKRQRIILSSIVMMANRLDIDIVVEGVETAENVALMKDLGCFVAQGYYFAKPMAEESFAKIFKEGILCTKKS